MCFVFLGLIVGGCANKPPTIAHTHIGHAMSGWHDTPGQKGLFIVAEESAQAALKASDDAIEKGKDLTAIKGDVETVVKVTDPERYAAMKGKQEAGYGVRNALSGALDHIVFAADSADASSNVKTSVESFSVRVQAVLDRSDLISALGGEVLASGSEEEATLLANELRKLTYANIYGSEMNGDGVLGSVPEEYGLIQLRNEIQAMIDREDPVYTTVDKWYLFNLIRLPSGEWVFRAFSSGKSVGGGSSY